MNGNEDVTDPATLHRRFKIAPSILTADFGRLAEQIQEAEEAGVDYIHLDVMDGHFVPNITLGPVVVSAVRKATRLPLDLHLMIEHPDRYAPAFADAGATSITVHQEVCPHLHRQIYQLKELGVRAGVALNPSTPLVTVEDVLADLDLLLVMCVNPGFGGQVFIPHTIDKLQRARALIEARSAPAELEVDGGVHVANIAEVARAGANVFVTGSAVYNREQSVAEAVSALRRALTTTYSA
jgi:ribulose-phosphate 3-epimerase